MNRLNLVCLGVRNLQKSLQFYKNIGFETRANGASAIVFLIIKEVS